MKKRLITAMLAAAAAVTLASCGATQPATPDDQTPVLSQPGDLTEVEYMLRDGRTVTCLIYDGYKEGGLSCDWSPVLDG